MTNTIVIARLNEDMKWTDHIPDHWEPFVVQKDVHCPNVGREPYSFLWYIVEYYDDIQDNDLFAFVQGCPFDHYPDLLGLLDNTKDITGEYLPLGRRFLTSQGDGGPHDIGLRVSHFYEKWLFKPFPNGVDFVAGGQFMVKGSSLKRYSKERYKTMMEDIIPDKNAWVLERLWGSLFL